MNFPFKKFVSYYQPYKGMFIIVLLCAFLTSSMALLFPLLVLDITKNVLSENLSAALPKMYSIGGLMLVLALVQNLTNYFVDYKGHEIGARMESDMRSELFAHMQKLGFSFYDREKTGQLMSRITNDLLLLAELYHHGPEDYMNYSVRVVGAFVILCVINAPLAVVVFCFMPFLIAFVMYFNRILNRAITANRERIADVNAQTEDSLAGIRVVKSFANERLEISKFDRANGRFLESRRKTYKSEAYFYNGLQVLVQLITIAVVVFGSVSIVHKTLSVAELITFLLYIAYVTDPIQRLGFMTTQFQEGITGFQRFMEILNLEPERECRQGAVSMSAFRGEVEFRDVLFTYDEHTSPVLNGLSLHIVPGEFVALVGASGAGKTTLCSLIPRFYEVTHGEVLLDGINVGDFELKYLRNRVGIVQQDVYLFDGTVMENIRYGNSESSDDEVVAAAKKAHAHDFIMALPKGYQSEIGQRGVRLSGGQKQRLSIARTFLKDPEILIFDEATSALDNESESAVQKSLEQVAAGRTTIVIAHRLSTIRNAQRIVVLHNGQIAEQGSHHELLARHGLYEQLYSKQFEI